MQNIKNNLTRHLEADELIPTLTAITAIEKAFKKKAFAVFINSDLRATDQIHSIMIQFDNHYSNIESGWK
ncbi:MAG: hypothetical protein Q8O88_01515 [bacterium]|nr:hypothetical protein [bacterium]